MHKNTKNMVSIIYSLQNNWYYPRIIRYLQILGDCYCQYGYNNTRVFRLTHKPKCKMPTLLQIKEKIFCVSISVFSKDALTFTHSCGRNFHKHILSCNVEVFYLIPMFVIQILEKDVLHNFTERIN